MHSSAAYMQCHTSNVALQSEYVQAVASYDEGVSLASFWRGRVRESEAKRDGLGFKRGRRTGESLAQSLNMLCWRGCKR